MSMRLLDRYILSSYLRYFRLTGGAFLALILVVNLFERIDEIIENQAGFFDAAYYFLLAVPVVGFQLIPMASLIAAILGLSALARDSEIIAMRSSGVSLYRTALPILKAGLLLTLITFLLGELVIPDLHAKAEEVKRTRIKRQTVADTLQRENIWLRGEGRRIYHVRRFEPEKEILHDVTIYEFTPGFQLLHRLDVQRMEWYEERWRLVDVTSYTFDRGKEMVIDHNESTVGRFPETISAFKRIKKRPEDMNAVELRRYIRRRLAEGSDVAPLRSDLHAKFSMPFSVLVLTLLAIPFAIHNPRSGGIGRSLAIGFALAIVYWFLLQIGLSLGHAAKLPPVFAAWISNLFFTVLGVYLLIHIRQ